MPLTESKTDKRADSTPAQIPPPFELVVVESFHGYSKGDVIADAQKVQDVLTGEWAGHVVQRANA